MPDDFNEIDLSALAPSREASFDVCIARIASDAMDAREQLRAAAWTEPTGVVSALTSWARPTVLAAGILLAVALTALVRTTTPSSPRAPVSGADAMGLPRSLADILHSTTEPSLVELGVAVASASR